MKKVKSRQSQTAKPGQQPRLRRLTPRRIIRLLALSSCVAGGMGLTGLRFYIPNEEELRMLGENPSMFLQDFERLNEIYQAILMGGVRTTLEELYPVPLPTEQDMVEGLTHARQKTTDIIEEFGASGEDTSGLAESVSRIEAYLQGQRTLTVPRISKRMYQGMLRWAQVATPVEDPEVVQGFLRMVEGYRQGEVELGDHWSTIHSEKERRLLESVTPQEESLVKEALPLIEPRLRLIAEQGHDMKRQMLLKLAPKRSSRGKK